MGIIGKAAEFAMWAHAGQKRKYTGEPYIVHCAEVAALVQSVNMAIDVTLDQMVAAAWLHDTIEDCPDKANYGIIKYQFGDAVIDMVWALTDTEEGNRATRKALSRSRLSSASQETKTIKLADLISNTRSIVSCDPSFAKLYLEEKRALLPLLKDGSRLLYEQAYEQAYAT